jgi:hypothetical protein
MDLNWTLANYDKLTPEEKWLAQKEFGGRDGGFYFNVIEPLLWAPPTPTEPYTPPKEEIPPSTYIPLAHR